DATAATGVSAVVSVLCPPRAHPTSSASSPAETTPSMRPPPPLSVRNTALLPLLGVARSLAQSVLAELLKWAVAPIRWVNPSADTQQLAPLPPPIFLPPPPGARPQAARQSASDGLCGDGAGRADRRPRLWAWACCPIPARTGTAGDRHRPLAGDGGDRSAFVA